MRSPANAEYRCPYTDRTCSKTNHTTSDPYPVCSIYRRSEPRESRTPICVCPVRFYETDIAGDVIANCWAGDPPTAPRYAYEVQMQKFGKVDLVIADVDDDRRMVRSFLPVELQAVDITGSVYPAYEALTNHRPDTGRLRYGFNWANVRKRFISQLIAKGYFCSQWGTRIVAVVQEDVFEQFAAHARVVETRLEDSNIVFMVYQFSRPSEGEPWNLLQRRVVPTTHAMVMNAILYEQAPDRAAFERRILERMGG